MEKILQENKGRKDDTCQLKVDFLSYKINLFSFSSVVYGITTGFGKFARTVIEPEKLK